MQGLGDLGGLGLRVYGLGQCCSLGGLSLSPVQAATHGRAMKQDDCEEACGRISCRTDADQNLGHLTQKIEKVVPGRGGRGPSIASS